MYKVRSVYAEGSTDFHVVYCLGKHSYMLAREKALSELSKNPDISAVYTYKLGWRGWRVMGSY